MLKQGVMAYVVYGLVMQGAMLLPVRLCVWGGLGARQIIVLHVNWLLVASEGQEGQTKKKKRNKKQPSNIRCYRADFKASETHGLRLYESINSDVCIIRKIGLLTSIFKLLGCKHGNSMASSGYSLRSSFFIQRNKGHRRMTVN